VGVAVLVTDCDVTIPAHASSLCVRSSALNCLLQVLDTRLSGDKATMDASECDDAHVHVRCDDVADAHVTRLQQAHKPREQKHFGLTDANQGFFPRLCPLLFSLVWTTDFLPTDRSQKTRKSVVGDSEREAYTEGQSYTYREPGTLSRARHTLAFPTHTLAFPTHTVSAFLHLQ